MSAVNSSGVIAMLSPSRLFTAALALASAIAVLALSTGSAAAQSVPSCDYYFPSDADEYVCSCDAKAAEGSIWGTGLYTSDSDMCTAARHAGVIGLGGGVVRAVAQPGQGRYPSSTQNGITSSEWGSYSSSIEFVQLGAQVVRRLPGCSYSLPSEETDYTCNCPAGSGEGSIWGTGIYTSDSDLCTAAIHAGAISAVGGDVRVLARPGQETYPASTRNGITSDSWGSYSSSIEFVQLAQVVPVTPVPLASGPVCGKFPVGAATHGCVCGAAGTAAGPVWGAGPYVTDSDICQAALHAGVIGVAGGPVVAFGLPGLASYVGSLRNGVQSYDWGPYGASFIFDGNIR